MSDSQNLADSPVLLGCVEALADPNVVEVILFGEKTVYDHFAPRMLIIGDTTIVTDQIEAVKSELDAGEHDLLLYTRSGRTFFIRCGSEAAFKTVNHAVHQAMDIVHNHVKSSPVTH